MEPKDKKLMETLPIPQSVYGMCDFEDVYWRMASEAPDECIFVELGCFIGQSSMTMARAIVGTGKKISMYCVDLWPIIKEGEMYRYYLQKWRGDLFRGWVENMAPFRRHVDIHALQCDSAQAARLFANQSVWFAFIDANHNRSSVVADVKAWHQKVAFGGYIGGHDVGPKPWPDVEPVVNGFYRDDWELIHRSWLHHKN